MADDADSKSAQFMVFRVGERLRGRYHDGFTGMYSQRIKILHITYRNTVVIAVTHYFVLNLFPPLE